jgi:hypothetical protein
MRGQMQILNNAQIAPREMGQKMQCTPSNATGAISPYVELGQRCGFSFVFAGRRSNPCENVPRRTHFEERKRRRILPSPWLAES